MPRYIEANKIKLTGMTFQDVNNEVYFSLTDVRKAIEQTPTEDVVEVVRCKDCTSYNGHRYCTYHADPVDDNDFCSYGERKDYNG